MARLGSVLEEEGSGPRGPDLVASVRVPRGALGHPDGVWVQIPVALEVDGSLVPRVVSPHDQDEEIQLHLPEGFPDGGSLRLRGQGGQSSAGRPGDLLVRVELTDDGLPVRAGATALASLSAAETFWLAVAALVLAAAVYLAL